MLHNEIKGAPTSKQDATHAPNHGYSIFFVNRYGCRHPDSMVITLVAVVWTYDIVSSHSHYQRMKRENALHSLTFHQSNDAVHYSSTTTPLSPLPCTQFLHQHARVKLERCLEFILVLWSCILRSDFSTS